MVQRKQEHVGKVMSKKVLITGVTGQDGSNMVDFLLSSNEEVKIFGMIRRSANPNFINCQTFLNHPNFQLVYADLVDELSIFKIVQEIQPDFLINFAANSFVGCSWDMPMQVFDANSMGVLRCLEAIRRYQPKCRFYSAGSSEEFGDVEYSPQDILHPLKPRSPYAVSKCTARHIVKVYRESYDMYAVHGILFNHEGLRRGEEFVTRKITKGVARIHNYFRSLNARRRSEGAESTVSPIELGNLDAKRDWSDSEDFVKGVWLMLNRDGPKDYVLASGETHSIREFVEKAFKCVDMEGSWVGEGIDEEYRYEEGGRKHALVKVNQLFYRPAEVEILLGDPTLAEEELNWQREISFDKLVQRMVLFDVASFEKGTNS